MKPTVLFIISMMLPGLLPPAAGQSKAQDLRSVELEIKNLETRRFQAMTRADVPALESLLSNDLVYTHATGWRQSKAEFLASLRTGEIQYHSIASDNVKVRVYGSTAVVTGTASIKAKAKAQEAQRRTRVSGGFREARRPVATGGVAIHAQRALT